MIILDGMLGMGDNFHQRAVVRHYLKSGPVTVVTPWPQIYHDLDVSLRPTESNLRTQMKNLRRSRMMYGPKGPNGKRIKVWYRGDQVRETGSILGAMLASCDVPLSECDFTFPVPDEWVERARSFVKTDKPILFYRPLVERKEWTGCANRNPGADAYTQLIEHLRDRYFVVSVADLQEGFEWISSGDIDADAKFHAGELGIETLCGLMKISSLAFCSPGFALVMAQAIGTPVICVFGGREDSAVYSLGAKLTPTLGIDTVKPCRCFDHQHDCEKRIDIPRAKKRIDDFVCGLA